MVQLRSHITALNRTLWLEMRTLIGITALLAALIILNTLKPNIPQATPAELPPAWQEPTADQVLPPDVDLHPPPFQSPPVQTLGQAQLQAILQALADALRDGATTRSVAEALDQGNINEAAEELRRLADRLDDLSNEGQQDIGDRLQEAANNIGSDMPALTEALEAGSEALNQGQTVEGGQALETVADILERMDDAPPKIAEAQPEEPPPSSNENTPQEEPNKQETEESGGGGDKAGNGDSSPPPTEDERLAGEGEPLELESDFDLEDRVLQPAELEGPSGDRVTQDSPFARQPTNVVGELGSDPLTYPWERREVVRSYFSP